MTLTEVNNPICQRPYKIKNMTNKKLSLALKINAAFSVFNGLAMLFFYDQIAAWMEISQPIFLLVIGIILLGFAALVYKTATANIISDKMVKFIIVQDWLWVVSSVLIIAFQAFGINRTGFIIIGVVALIVADFAIFQQRYLKVST